MNSGSVVASVFAHSGLVSNGSLDWRQLMASSIDGGNVVCALPGGIPVFPLAYSAPTMLCFGKPTGLVEAEPSKGGSAAKSCEWRPVGTSESTRSVQPYFGAAAASCMSTPPGLFHSGPVKPTHEKPPP